MFKGLEEIVKETLEENPVTRDSDWSCIRKVIEKCGFDDDISFKAVCRLGKDGMLPTFESITRVRRKLQSKYPHLRANDTVKAFREQKEIEMKECLGYANN